MTHILDEQIHDTAIRDAAAHAGRVGKCDEPTDEGTPCGCEFTLPTDTDAIVLCPACGSSAILEPVSLPPAPEARQASSEETRACLACGGAHIITKCPAIKAAMDEAPGCVQPLGELEELKERIASDPLGCLACQASRQQYIDALAELMDLGEWTWSEADDCTLYTIHLRESHHKELTELLSEAAQS